MPYTWPVTTQDADDDLNLTGTTSNTELQKFIDAATAILENHPSYRIADAVKQTTYTEWVDAGNDTIVLQHYPVVSVSSVTEYTNGTSQTINAEPLDGGTFSGYGWTYQDGTGTNGILIRLSGGSPTRWCGNRVKIVYTAGVTTVPADLRLAALLLVEHLWETQRGVGGQGLPSGEQIPEGQPDFSLGSAFILPNRVREALAAYERTPSVA